ncbi:hypothetical protein HPB48_014477 [Haemaphysalis longicornis]|uniref:ABC transporter n=1 Tax=Haemaphysalis longicornis TaxID=44386 RepID=A0A9J6GCG3_HAELO|nr:hypothetical protein HPB48_014477 [Haemaphysalis longicornis]
MDECEAACDRVGIMAGGQFRCLGPVCHLLNCYGPGSTLVLNMNGRPDCEQIDDHSVDSVVNQLLPQSTRLRSYKGSYEYQIDKNLSWAAIVTTVEQLKAVLGTEDVWLSPATLEHVFAKFMATDRQNEDSAAPDASG